VQYGKSNNFNLASNIMLVSGFQNYGAYGSQDKGGLNDFKASTKLSESAFKKLSLVDTDKKPHERYELKGGSKPAVGTEIAKDDVQLEQQALMKLQLSGGDDSSLTAAEKALITNADKQAIVQAIAAKRLDAQGGNGNQVTGNIKSFLTSSVQQTLGFSLRA
jgi:hypothetical protein